MYIYDYHCISSFKSIRDSFKEAEQPIINLVMPVLRLDNLPQTAVTVFFPLDCYLPYFLKIVTIDFENVFVSFLILVCEIFYGHLYYAQCYKGCVEWKLFSFKALIRLSGDRCTGNVNMKWRLKKLIEIFFKSSDDTFFQEMGFQILPFCFFQPSLLNYLWELIA